MARSLLTMATTAIQAITKAFGFGVRRYVDGREVPNFRSEDMKPKEKMPMGKGKGKGKDKKC